MAENGNGDTKALVQKLVWAVLTITVSGVITLSVATVRDIKNHADKLEVALMVLQGKHRDVELVQVKKIEQFELLVARVKVLEVAVEMMEHPEKQRLWGNRYGREE